MFKATSLEALSIMLNLNQDEIYMLALLTNITFCQALDDSRILDAQTKGHVSQDPLIILFELHQKLIRLRSTSLDVPVDGFLHGAGI